MKQRLSPRLHHANLPCAQAGRSAGENWTYYSPGKPLRSCEKQFSIGFEPKRLGSLASPASAFALERESGREVLVYRARRNQCAKNVSTYESTSKPIGTFFCQVTPSNILLLCDNGRAERRIVSPIRDGFYIRRGEVFSCNTKLRGQEILVIVVSR